MTDECVVLSVKPGRRTDLRISEVGDGTRLRHITGNIR